MSTKLSYGQTLALVAKKFPDKDAFICGDKRYTFKQFDERCNRLANGLLELGVLKGDNVATLFVSRIEIFENYYGITKMGAVVVPLNFRLAPGEYITVLNHSNAQVLIYEEMYQQLVDAIRPKLPGIKHYIKVGSNDDESVNYDDLISNALPDEPKVDIDGSDNAFILYTAGTTGTPKGVVRTHENQLLGAVNFVALPVTCFGPDAILLSCPPAFHCATQEVAHSIMMLGGTNILLPLYKGFDPAEVLKTVQQEKATGLWMVPTMWMATLAYPEIGKFDLSSLKLASNGGAIMPLAMKQKIIKLFPNAELMDFFGMTEMNPWTCILTGDDALRKPDSVGKPVTTVDIRIWDDQCHDVPRGEVGEIVYSGPSVMKEYHRDPQQTSAAMKGGYFHTGDLVRQDEEGFVYVVDRKKDMIISGGENIYPAEVEMILSKNPKIESVAVIGIPDAKWGESVKAVVKLREGQSATQEEIMEYCKNDIARYKAPRSIDFVTEFPESSTGKVLKRELREKYSK